MEIKPIHNETDYEATLARIEEIFDAEPGSDEDQELDLQVALVERYEDRLPINPLVNRVSRPQWRRGRQPGRTGPGAGLALPRVRC
jgi:hypothetical protein